MGWSLPDLVAEAQRLRYKGESIKAVDWPGERRFGFEGERNTRWVMDLKTLYDWKPTGPRGRKMKEMAKTWEGRQALFERWVGETADVYLGWDEDPLDLGGS